MRRLLRKATIKLEPIALIAAVAGFIKDAESLSLTGPEKRDWVAKRVADFLDDHIKLPFFLELLDGPVFFVLAVLVQMVFDAGKKKNAA